MKDTDGEPLTPPNTGPLSKDELRPLIASTADEIVPFAVSLIVDGEASLVAFERLILLGVDSRSPIDPTATRALIYRVTAAGIALLALDERVRGEEVISREMTALSEKGIR